MKNIFYRMRKRGWDERTGEYSTIERNVGPLTLAQVQARVGRLPDSTICQWSIAKYESHGGNPDYLLGTIDAEEFESDVPEYDTGI